MFKKFYVMINTQYIANIKILKIDNEKEYFKSILGSSLSKKGIIHQISYIITPQQNYIVERKDHHLLEVARAIIFTNNMSKYL